MKFIYWYGTSRTDKHSRLVRLMVSIALLACMVLLSLFVHIAALGAQGLGPPRSVVFGARYANGVPVEGIVFGLELFDLQSRTDMGGCTTDATGTCVIEAYGGYQYLVHISGYASDLDLEVAPADRQAQTLGHGETRGVGLYVANGGEPLEAYYVMIPREDGYVYPTWDRTNHRAFPAAMTPEPALPETSEFARDEGVVTAELEASGGATPTSFPRVATVGLPTPEPTDDRVVATTDEDAGPLLVPEVTVTPNVNAEVVLQQPRWMVWAMVICIVGTLVSGTVWLVRDYLPGRRQANLTKASDAPAD